MNQPIKSSLNGEMEYARGYKCAYPTDEFHGWGCKITGSSCIFLFPDCKSAQATKLMALMGMGIKQGDTVTLLWREDVMILMQGKGVSKGVVKGPIYFYQRIETAATHTATSNIDVTLDGRKMMVYCNIGSPEDVAGVLSNDGQGIGLFRSEFLYLASSDYPTEEEQFHAYKSAAPMGGKRVVIRTLAIGIDDLSVSPSSVLPLRAEIRKSIAKTCTLERLEC